MKTSTLLLAALAGMLALAGPAAGRPAGVVPVIELKVLPAEFSPNGDGIKDAMRASIQVDEAVTLTIEIVSERGPVVFTNAPGVVVQQPGEVGFRWNGKARTKSRSAIARDGRYSLRVTAVDAAGGTAEAAAPILVDTRPPLVIWRAVSPSVLEQGPLFLHFRVYDPTERVRLQVVLEDQAGNPVPAGRASTLRPGSITLRWPKVHSARLPPRAYRIAVATTDGAGNASASSQRTFLVVHSVRSQVYALFHGVGRHLALTFDDCNFGSSWTSVLNTLARFKVKATFFCPGRQVLAYPQLARRTVREGHSIGSHGWDHANFGALSFGAALQRLEDDRDVWWRLARVAPTPYFRPPYGTYTASTMAAAGRAGYGAVVLWDVDPKDWTRPGSGVIESRILTRVHPGSIVILHVLPQTAAMLPSLLRDLRRRRYLPVTLSELDWIGTPSSGGWPPHRSGTSGA